MPDPLDRNANDDAPADAPTEFEQRTLDDDRRDGDQRDEETPTGGMGILTGIAQA